MFLTNPDVPLDNSMAERAQRPTVLDHKIHLGSRFEFGTRVSAAMYSLVQSARRVGVDPADYLRAAATLTLSDPRRQAVLLPNAFAAQKREADAAT
jgi:transposase